MVAWRERERGHEDEVATLITPETCGSRTASIVKADDDLEQNVLMSDNGCHGAEMEEGLSSHVKKKKHHHHHQPTTST